MTFRKGSRYASASPFTTGNGEPVFPGVRPREIGPAAPVLEHTVQAGDRLDRLARQYYGDERLWWRIVDANPRIFYGGDLLRAGADALPVANGSLSLERMTGRSILIPGAEG